MSGTLKREFTLWSAFAFAFAFISPIVAIYGIFGLAYSTAGPGFWWNFVLVFGGQILVAMIFAELVSKWPVEGSIYQWTRRLTGKGAGWFAGWFYMWTLVVAMATVAMGAASFVANVIGLTITPGMQATIAFIILALGTLANLSGRGVLKILLAGSIIAEIIGSVGLGIWLLLFHVEQPLSSITTGLDTVVGSGFTNSSFLIAMAFVGWAFVGFESAGSIAEEVKEERNIDIPVMVSGTITDASGRTLSGQTVEAFLISISHIPLLSVGFNCALGADQLKPYLKRLGNNTSLNISAHPNAGLPNAFGQYDQTPEEMQQLIREYLQENLVNIIGGCCGTTPKHIQLIAEVAKEFKPRESVLV